MTTTPLLPRHLLDDRPVALLIRHAERPPIPIGSDGMSLSLTERGVRDARDLGRALGSRIVQVHTSAVLRCVETASFILEGAGLSLVPIEDPIIGVPGAFIRPTPDARRTMRELGVEGLIRHMVVGEGALPGLIDPKEGARVLREHVLDSLTRRVGLHLFVTHDAMIAALVARSWPGCIGEPLPDFLEAAALWRDGDRVVLSYRQHWSDVACLP